MSTTARLLPLPVEMAPPNTECSIPAYPFINYHLTALAWVLRTCASTIRPYRKTPNLHKAMIARFPLKILG